MKDQYLIDEVSKTLRDEIARHGITSDNMKWIAEWASRLVNELGKS